MLLNKATETAEMFLTIIFYSFWEFQKRIHHEEIRRRLQMGEEDAYFKNLLNKDKPGRKPSLHSRLQNGMKPFSKKKK